MQSASEFVEQLRPAGGRRSSKRDFIVGVFLRQEGHFSADHFVDIIRRADKAVSRATVYRTLQWMVEAGMARRVDFGGGRFRFEHAYRHPRHFHLICKSCIQSFEFLSSDIETLVEEVASALVFKPRLFGHRLDRIELLALDEVHALQDPLGLAAHGIGTARAFQVSETMGAFAGLAMGLNGLATAFLFPLALRFWG